VKTWTPTLEGCRSTWTDDRFKELADEEKARKVSVKATMVALETPGKLEALADENEKIALQLLDEGVGEALMPPPDGLV
jgi:hypothetical protein